MQKAGLIKQIKQNNKQLEREHEVAANQLIRVTTIQRLHATQESQSLGAFCRMAFGHQKLLLLGQMALLLERVEQSILRCQHCCFMES